MKKNREKEIIKKILEKRKTIHPNESYYYELGDFTEDILDEYELEKKRR